MPEVPTGETHGLYATENAFCFDASTVLYWVNGEEILCELPPIRNPNFVMPRDHHVHHLQL
jgi:hypothetical protein